MVSQQDGTDAVGPPPWVPMIDELWQEYTDQLIIELRLCSAGLDDRLSEVCSYALLPPGKLLRPLLCMESATALGADPRIVIRAAAGLELAHVGSLVQDDVIDSDLMRRGRASVFDKYGVNAAIVSGDAMISSLFDALTYSSQLGVPEKYAVRAIQHASQAICAMCLGQLLEDRLSGRSECDLDSYLEMIRNKTAAAFRGSCEIGAILAGGTADEVAVLGDYGEQLGIAFQIRDDLLPFTESEHEVGKPITSDLENSRPTLPIILASRALEIPRSVVVDRYRNESFESVVILLENAGALERSWEMAREYVSSAVQRLFSIPDSPSRGRLMKVAHYAMERTL
ncbi:polyprenyl synthetase family protein [Nocardia sp. NPDC049149]|uniref:polyprenyl synthetase family protein n=1 Tax=Nocardia sp. NPDC049149 TaxID=3364315 RepID=UPI003719FC1B